MPITHSGEISVRVVSNLANTSDHATVKADIDKTFSNAFTTGTGANQANDRWSDRRTLATGANEDLDLSGALTDDFGTSLVFTRIVAIVIVSLATNTTNLTVTQPAANGVPFTLAAGDGVVIAPGGMFVLTNPSATGIAVTAATGDLINIANAAGASASYDIFVFGSV